MNTLLLALALLGTTSERVELLPLGVSETWWLQPLARALATRFPASVRICPTEPPPEYARVARREQYLSPVILDSLCARSRRDAGGHPPRLLAIVDGDLFAPGLEFVFGQADLVDRVAVVSTARLKDEYALNPVSRARFMRRLIREAAHEVGHTYGLGHCVNPTCVMFFSKDLAETDRKSSYFCRKCTETMRKQLKSR